MGKEFQTFPKDQHSDVKDCDGRADARIGRIGTTFSGDPLPDQDATDEQNS